MGGSPRGIFLGLRGSPGGVFEVAHPHLKEADRNPYLSPTLKRLLSDHEPKHFLVMQWKSSGRLQAIEQALKTIYGHVQSVKRIYWQNFYQMCACRSVIYHWFSIILKLVMLILEVEGRGYPKYVFPTKVVLKRLHSSLLKSCKFLSFHLQVLKKLWSKH